MTSYAIDSGFMTVQERLCTASRYREPAFDEFQDDDFDEIISCETCGHCLQITDGQCKRVWSRMSPYGKWHEREREVKNVVRNALKYFGVCEVRGELVDLTDVPCDHFTEVGE